MPSAANTHYDAIMRAVPERDAIDRLIEKHGPDRICAPLLPMMTPERIARIAGVLVTRGAHRWIDLARWPDADHAIAALRVRGFRVYATAPGATVSVEDVDVSTPLAILFGNEHAGVSETAIAASDGAIGVPMFGFTESFNLSVTVGLAMSRIATRRRAYLNATGDLAPERLAHLRARWFALRIRGVVGVLERALGKLARRASPRDYPAVTRR